MHELDLLDGMLREVDWLRESATQRRRMRSLRSGQPASVRPLFCEVVIEWDDATLDSAAESVGC